MNARFSSLALNNVNDLPPPHYALAEHVKVNCKNLRTGFSIYILLKETLFKDHFILLFLGRMKGRKHVSTCAVVCCTSPKEQSYHVFPSDPLMAKKWLMASGNKKVAKSAKICGKHFEESAFKNLLKVNLLGIPLRKLLDESAIPTLYLPDKDQTGEKKFRNHHKCSVISCTSPIAQSYHSFPTDPVMANKWLIASGNKKANIKTARICGKHFEESAYKNHLKAKLLGIPLRKLLDVSALPTLYLPREQELSDSVEIQGRSWTEVKEEEYTVEYLETNVPQQTQTVSVIGNDLPQAVVSPPVTPKRAPEREKFLQYPPGSVITTPALFLGDKKLRKHYNCSVICCSSPRDQSYHSFPTDPLMANKWLIASGKKKANIKTARICGKHFEESAYKKSMRNLLEKSALPTLHLPYKNQTVPVPSDRKLENKKIVSDLLEAVNSPCVTPKPPAPLPTTCRRPWTKERPWTKIDFDDKTHCSTCGSRILYIKRVDSYVCECNFCTLYTS